MATNYSINDGKDYLSINEGDYGKPIIFTISPRNAESTYKFKVRTEQETFEIDLNYQEGDIYYLQLREEDSKVLTKGTYEWGLAEYQEGVLYDTLVDWSLLVVEEGV